MRIDPLLTATDDLAGMALNTEKSHPVDLDFLAFVATRLNGTIRLGLHGDPFVMYIPFQKDLFRFTCIRVKKSSFLYPDLINQYPQSTLLPILSIYHHGSQF